MTIEIDWNVPSGVKFRIVVLVYDGAWNEGP